MNTFNETNTEGYTQTQLNEMNEAYAAWLTDNPDACEDTRKHRQEQILTQEV